MAATAKVSVAIGNAELGWARERARRERKSLSAVVTEMLAAQRRLEALAEVVGWMSEGRRPLTKAEVAEAARELRSRRR
jgi:hypothetical protein